MADPKAYERDYSFRSFPDDAQNARQLGLLLDQQFDQVAEASEAVVDKVNRGLITRVVLTAPGTPVSFEDGVLAIPRGAPGVDGAGLFETWLTQNPGGTEDQFLEDMRAAATPELLAARDAAVSASESATAASAAAMGAAGVAQAAAAVATDAAGVISSFEIVEFATDAAAQAYSAAHPHALVVSTEGMA